MSSPVTLIEQGLVNRLRAVTRSYTPLVESYGAQLDDETFGWIRSLPAVWVTFDGARPTRVGPRTWRYQGTFEVLVAQRNLVQDRARQADDSRGQDVGVYQLLEDNKLALVNATLGLQIEPLAPGAIRSVAKSLVNRDAITVMAQQFATAWTEIYPDPALAPAGDLITVGLSYLLKPGDDESDASDQVTTLVAP